MPTDTSSNPSADNAAAPDTDNERAAESLRRHIVDMRYAEEMRVFALKLRHARVHAVAGYLMRCPGCGQESALPLGSSPGARWTVTAGDPRTGAGLTLSPSVWHRVLSCGWHGWVRDGRWVPC